MLVAPGGVGELHDRIGVGDVQIVADERHAERRIETGEKRTLELRDAIAVRIAQQRDAIGRRHGRAGLGHHLLLHRALDALAIFRTRRRGGFGHQHIAVRQGVQPARMLEAAGEGVHLDTGRRRRLHVRRPALGFRDLHHRDGLLLGLRQRRIGADGRCGRGRRCLVGWPHAAGYQGKQRPGPAPRICDVCAWKTPLAAPGESRAGSSSSH